MGQRKGFREQAIEVFRCLLLAELAAEIVDLILVAVGATIRRCGPNAEAVLRRQVGLLGRALPRSLPRSLQPPVQERVSRSPVAGPEVAVTAGQGTARFNTYPLLAA